MKSFALVIFALTSVTAQASPDCFKDVKDYKSASEAGQFCHHVSDTCFNEARKYYGPLKSANDCRDVATTCFNDMYSSDGIGTDTAATMCRGVDEDCYRFHREHFTFVREIAASCMTAPAVVAVAPQIAPAHHSSRHDVVKEASPK